jgi:hypothetical protein
MPRRHYEWAAKYGMLVFGPDFATAISLTLAPISDRLAICDRERVLLH